ncbi:MAG TPA: CHAT domain-containing tetratricopeptide repeat protein [Thermoanaerobaculia bacterium]|nr:CHAT domain-containing tetratricopeptide repeat protein [Thermoanaerobaculia bacterium]
MYSFEMPAGCYLRLRAEELDVELAVELLDLKGRRLAASGGPPGSGSTLRLSAITASAGIQRLVVARPGPPARPVPRPEPGAPRLPGRHRIVLEALRPASSGDADLVAAQRLAAEGIRRGALVGLRKDDRPRVERWLSRFRAAGDARAEVDARNGFVPLFIRGGDLEEAEALARQARARAREVRYLAGEAASLDLLGSVEHTRGGREDLPRARADLEQALVLWRRLGRRSEEGKTLYRVGHLDHDLADPERARQAYAQAQDIAREEKDKVLLRDSLSGLGAIHYQTGNYGAAERCWKETFSLSKGLHDVEDEAVNAANLAAIWQSRGKIGQAREILADALADALERNSDREQRALLLYRLASVDILLGDPDHRALGRYQKSQEIWHELGNRAWEANAWSGIGWIDFLQQRYEAALTHFARAADGVVPNGLPVVQIEMGMAHLALRQPAVALHDFAAARDAARKGGSRTLEGLALLHLGEALRVLRRTTEALGVYQQAIAFGKELNYPDLHAAGLLRRAELRSDAGRLKEALADGAEALHIVESARSLAASSQVKQGFLTARRKYYDFALDVLMRLERLHPGQYRTAALDVSERARARVLLDLLAEGRIDPGQDLPPDLKRRQDEAQDRLSDIQAQIAFERGAHPTGKSGRLAQLEGELEAQEDGLQRIEEETRRRLPKYAAIRYPVPLGLHAIQRLLDPETALLEYALGEKSGALFVITHDGFQSFPLPAAGEIERYVHRLRERLNKSGSRELGDYAYQAHQMYRTLVAPAAAILAGKPRLIIAPDRSLYYLPFEALLTSHQSPRRYSDLPYLLKEHSIAYVPSASVLANLRSRRPRREDASRAKSFVAFAYPVTPRAVLPPGASRTAISPAPAEVQWLPEARNEVEGIAKLYRPDQVKLYLDDEAREDRVQSQEVAGAMRVHFATHAQIDEEHPELSSLQLAPSQGPRQAGRGLLLAQRIFQLKLDAELVVLSACSTALGKEVTGEGLVGLTRAFLYAGAPSVVVTLRNVSDAAARDLMISFYRHLDSGAWKAEALRQAKLEALQRGGLDAQPASWAPFILIGDPR